MQIVRIYLSYVYKAVGIIYPDFLMRNLSVPAFLDDSHDDIFGSHERQFLSDSSCYDLGIHNESFGYILQS